MTLKWDSFISQLNEFPEGTHNFVPAGPETRIAKVEAEFGKMPSSLIEMVRHCNGAQLFCNTGPLITLFGISPRRRVSRFEWAPDWYIDKFTRVWREVNPESDLWAFAMWNFGCLMVLSGNGRVREWDMSVRDWGQSFRSMNQWYEFVIDEGRVCMLED